MSTEPGDLVCLSAGCTRAAVDGWWVGGSGVFRYACDEHAPIERIADAPDGVFDTPPDFPGVPLGTQANPGNVPTPQGDQIRAALRPAPLAQLEYLGWMSHQVGAKPDHLGRILGDGYTQPKDLSQWAASFAIFALMQAYVELVSAHED